MAKKNLHTNSHTTFSRKKNYATSSYNKSRNLSRIFFCNLSAKKTSTKINQATWVSEWEKSCNLSTQKILAPSPHTKSGNLSKKKSGNLSTKKIMQPLNKTLQELQNAALRTSHQLSNVLNCSFQSTEKVFFYSSDCRDIVLGAEMTTQITLKLDLLFFF